jgi:trk system potassium uptake protein
VYRTSRSVFVTIQKLIWENFVVRIFISAYVSSLLVGCLLLHLPFCQKKFISATDLLFTAASALSTTGLVTVPIDEVFSFFGQVTLLFLIQIGGLGYTTFSSFLILSLERKREGAHQAFAADSLSLSRGLTIGDLIKRVLKYTFFCELLGTIALYFCFKNEQGALWQAIFHSISAFCTAGFSLFSSNLMAYKGHLGINLTLSLLSILGAFSFLSWVGLSEKRGDQISSKRKDAEKFNLGMAKGIFKSMRSFTAVMILSGTLFFFILTDFKGEGKGHELLISFFQTVSAITTAGFNTVDIGSLSTSSLIFLMGFMFLGVLLTGRINVDKGSSALFLLQRIIKGDKMKRLRSLQILFKKIVAGRETVVSYPIVLSLPIFLLLLIEKKPFLPLLFEAVSAICTVGLGTGITPELTRFGKGLITLLMLTGRSGILIYVYAMLTQALSSQKEKESVVDT